EMDPKGDSNKDNRTEATLQTERSSTVEDNLVMEIGRTVREEEDSSRYPKHPPQLAAGASIKYAISPPDITANQRTPPPDRCLTSVDRDVDEWWMYGEDATPFGLDDIDGDNASESQFEPREILMDED